MANFVSFSDRFGPPAPPPLGKKTTSIPSVSSLGNDAAALA